MLEISELIWLAVSVLCCVYWWQATGVKQTALSATKQYCKRIDVQFLDDALVLHRYWFKKDENGVLRVWRSYVFEFSSTGEHRYQGCIILLGDIVLDIQMEPYRT